jgi:hypothetical protein
MKDPSPARREETSPLALSACGEGRGEVEGPGERSILTKRAAM